jgi:hypothetical protein
VLKYLIIAASLLSFAAFADNAVGQETATPTQTTTDAATPPAPGNTATVDPNQLTAVTTTTPDSVAALIGDCTPVIDAQYRDSAARRGECVNPTKAFLDAQKANTSPADMGKVVANTVTELVKLYRPQDCKKQATELPDAIAASESYTTDQVQIDALKQIIAALTTCQDIQTGAVPARTQLSANTI